MEPSDRTLTLYYELHQGFPRFDVEAVVLAGLAAVRATHLTRHVDDAQHAIVAFHLHAPVWHRHLFISSGPQDDGLGLS